MNRAISLFFIEIVYGDNLYIEVDDIKWARIPINKIMKYMANTIDDCYLVEDENRIVFVNIDKTCIIVDEKKLLNIKSFEQILMEFIFGNKSIAWNFRK